MRIDVLKKIELIFFLCLVIKEITKILDLYIISLALFLSLIIIRIDIKNKSYLDVVINKDDFSSKNMKQNNYFLA